MEFTRNLSVITKKGKAYCVIPWLDHGMTYVILFMPHNLKQLFEKHNIKGLSINSKAVKNNDVFFAIKGQSTDGNDFISDALSKGAALVITDNSSVNIDPNKVIYVEDVQAALYEAIEIFYPKKPKNLIAVTGTNGKSSVVSYIAQTYSLLGEKAASIGTIGVEIFGCDNFINDVPALTTLDYLSFRKIAHNLAENGIEYLAFEASSHGLDQTRLGETKVNIACFTSFSQDHLDYHHTKENYLSVKLKLFTDHLLPNGIAILNSDIEEIEFIKDYLNKHNIKFITVGIKGDLQISKINSSLRGQDINFTFNNREYNFNTPIIGSFQASNLLIAALTASFRNLDTSEFSDIRLCSRTIVRSAGSIVNSSCLKLSEFSCTELDFNKIIEILTKVKPVKGRMQRIENTNIFIDYAHTPDALEKVLMELKNIKLRDSKLSVVFGCGGNRDKIKRSLMGQIAAKLADHVIITDDNPRLEDPKLIRAEIVGGIDKANYIEIENREEAIKCGINNLKQNDILLIAGKGHENYQIIGDKKLPFDDAEIVKKYIKGTLVSYRDLIAVSKKL